MCDNKQFKFLDHKLKESNYMLIAFVLNDFLVTCHIIEKTGIVCDN